MFVFLPKWENLGPMDYGLKGFFGLFVFLPKWKNLGPMDFHAEKWNLTSISYREVKLKMIVDLKCES